MVSTHKVLTPIRIVVADDHPIFREGLIKLLETKPDLRVVGAANDGDEALKLVAELEPDLLLLDLAMPRKHGEQFRAEQMRNPRLARIPVVIMSADASIRSKAETLGVQGWMPKPADPEALLRIAQRCAGRRVTGAARCR